MTTEAKREAIARVICVALGDDPEREGPFSEWANESPYAVAADAIMALAEPVSDDSVRERWRHVKRGTVYEVIGEAELQNANTPGLREGAVLTVYRGDDGKLWAREHKEFRDGRFERLTAAPASEPQALSEERAREVLAHEVADAESGKPADLEWREWLLAKPGRLDRTSLNAPTAIRAMIRFATETQKGSGE